MSHRQANFTPAARPTGKSIVYSANGGYSLFARCGITGSIALMILVALRLIVVFHLQGYFYELFNKRHSDLSPAALQIQKTITDSVKAKINANQWIEAVASAKWFDQGVTIYNDQPHLHAEFMAPIDQLGVEAQQDYDRAGGTTVREDMRQYDRLSNRHPVAAYKILKEAEKLANSLERQDPGAQTVLPSFQGAMDDARVRYHRAMQHRAKLALARKLFLQAQARIARHQQQVSGIFQPVAVPPASPARTTVSPEPQAAAPRVVSAEDRALQALRSSSVYLGATRRANELVDTLGRQINNARTPWRGISDRTHAAAELLGLYVNLRSLAANAPLNVKIDDQLRQLNGHLSVQDNPIEGSILGVRSQRNILAIWAAQRAKASRQFAAHYQALGAAGKWKLLAPAPIPQIQTDYATANRRVLALFKLNFASQPADGAAVVAAPTLLQPRAAATTAAQRKASAAQRKMLQVLLAALAQKDNAMAQTIAGKLNGALPTETSAIVVQEDYLQGIVWCLQYLIRDL